MEKTRVEKLIEFLYGRCCSLSYACHKLGFDEDDLTDTEEDELYESIFQCEECWTWIDANDEEVSSDGRSICSTCYYNLEEEEDG